MEGALEGTGTSPHVRAKHEQRRREILQAALGEFREHGYHATTLGAIAGRLGMRKTALYHYFADKESILHACHRDSLAQLERIVADARRFSAPAERLHHVIVEHVRVVTETLDGSPLAFDVASLAPERRAEVAAGRDRYEYELRSVIDTGIEAGVFRSVDSKVAAFVILGAINWITRWYRPEGVLGAEALGEQFATQLVGGLLAPAGALRRPRAAAGAKSRVSARTRARRSSRAAKRTGRTR